MSVFIDSKRGRWRYDFVVAGRRFAGYCLDPETRARALDREAAQRIEVAIRLRIPAIQTDALRHASAPPGPAETRLLRSLYLEPRNTEIERVYFIRIAGIPLVKVGRAVDPMGRLGDLQVGSPFELLLLGSIPGRTAVEKAIHQRFDAQRVRGEWFRLDARLAAFIRVALEQHGVGAPLSRRERARVSGTGLRARKAAQRAAIRELRELLRRR